MTARYVVATVKPWNIQAYQHRVRSFSGHWQLIDNPDDLRYDVLDKSKPDFIFFPHWSWRVPDEIVRDFHCVCFHETDLPFGRGGSPIQNLIAGGHQETKITALRMVEDMDAGPIYLKRPLSLKGSAQQIFERAAAIVMDMIDEIATKRLVPLSQQGSPTIFKRRTPDQSVLPAVASAKELYDHIRMLDAETYPPAFLDFGNLRIEFGDAELTGDTVKARVSIRPHNQTET